MIIAFTFREAEPGQQQKAVVMDIATMRVGVVCVKVEDSWEPVYMIREIAPGIGARGQLPRCFELGDEALEALENVWVLEPDQSGEVS